MLPTHTQPDPRPAGKPWAVAELADHLAISHRHLCRLIAAGRVRVVRFGRRVAVPAAEADRLMTEGAR